MANNKSKYNPTKELGFTLIELIIVVAIVAILASISMGLYTSYIIKANRTDARSALTETATSLEKCRALYGAYDNASCNVSLPLDSEKGYYAISGAPAATSFLLTATPKTGTPQVNDKECSTLTFTNTGIESGTGTDITQCW